MGRPSPPTPKEELRCYPQVGVPNSVLADARFPFASNVVWRKMGLVRSLPPPGAINLIGPTFVTVASPLSKLVSNARLNTTMSWYWSPDVSPVPVALKTLCMVPEMVLSVTVDVLSSHPAHTADRRGVRVPRLRDARLTLALPSGPNRDRRGPMAFTFKLENPDGDNRRTARLHYRNASVARGRQVHVPAWANFSHPRDQRQQR
jgi:hypothetical protein